MSDELSASNTPPELPVSPEPDGGRFSFPPPNAAPDCKGHGHGATSLNGTRAIGFKEAPPRFRLVDNLACSRCLTHVFHLYSLNGGSSVLHPDLPHMRVNSTSCIGTSAMAEASESETRKAKTCGHAKSTGPELKQIPRRAGNIYISVVWGDT
ncbi:MAG TPA: hypothetical protein VGO47_05150 [Chlamydiales bacterium]|nr:hypothetical protein [Chlamydiales bacterium]